MTEERVQAVDSTRNPKVSVVTGCTGYPKMPPFSPDTCWPEYPFASELNQETNPAYDGVRRALALLGLDKHRYGQPSWNPLGDLIVPGNTVVIKPNFVREFRESDCDHGDCLFTHGSVIRAVVDYVYIALRGNGRIIIADAPHNDADFAELCRLTGVNEIVDFYQKCAQFEIHIYDLRPERAFKREGIIIGHRALGGDPMGYVDVDLNERSKFYEIEHLCHMLYGSEYDRSELRTHHHHGRHQYRIARTVLNADVVVSIPKLKTHKKAGITVNMKNLVGINGNKNWLPHHREGRPAHGGDQFADDKSIRYLEHITVTGFKYLFPWLGPLRSRVARPIKRVGTYLFGDTNKNTVRSGNWCGNDTVWRMVSDLNRILLYARESGVIGERPARRFTSIVDGIIAGEKNGPLDAIPRQAGWIVAGLNSIAVDCVCARLMGFDYQKIPCLARAFDEHELRLVNFMYDDIVAISSNTDTPISILGLNPHGSPFKPHFGWSGHIELSMDSRKADSPITMSPKLSTSTAH